MNIRNKLFYLRRVRRLVLYLAKRQEISSPVATFYRPRLIIIKAEKQKISMLCSC